MPPLAKAKKGSWIPYAVLIVLAFGLGTFLRTMPDRAELTSPPVADKPSRVITVDETGWTACPTRLGFETVAQAASSEDNGASARAYEAFGCTKIPRGQPVYREEGSAFGTVVGIRYVGETELRWTSAEAIR
ncbi:hypothetical protein GCM10008955_10810 [Deinococcus malanensis]|uniref:Uncharacterized protein n=1 Tax=Deinococcus malanensis TaxID=1706855 RepID=A0ABQ2ERS4_9DEIO|nr:hypothetical protein [Deinococcus malanensis]GGK19195.1 hypothetical protein GCM10008955_10810 [Deinococcus malanensis]